MRALRPDRLYPLTSGLWVLDDVQPVAAVLDPDGGAPRVVSWEQLPPPAPGEAWAAPVVLGDGEGLWVQHEREGAVARVTVDGVVAAVWTGGLGLVAAGHATAWCAAPPPAQELVQGADAHPTTGTDPSQLLRVDARGGCSRHWVPGPVRSAHATSDALLVEVDVEGWSLNHLGEGRHEVLRPTRWLALGWQDPVPEHLTLADHALPDGTDPDHADLDGGRGHYFWHAPRGDQDPLLAGGLRWHLGRVSRFAPDRGTEDGADRKVVASAHDDDGAPVALWDLGQGSVRAAVSAGAGVVVSLDRSPWPAVTTAGAVVALDPDRQEVRVLLTGDAVDVEDRCWPLVTRPPEVESYLAQQLAAHSSLDAYWTTELLEDGSDHAGAGSGVEPVVSPLAGGMREARTTLDGEWPRTQLEWTFRFDPLPGLLLRRRVALFDELGRLHPPGFADIHLMEDLETRNLPPAGAADDGVLDV